MIACRSRSILASIRGSLERPTCLLLSRTYFSTIAPPQQAAAPTKIDSAARGPSVRLPLALQALYYQPLRRVATHGLPVCDLQLRSFSVRNLEFMCDFALRTAYYCHLPAFGPVPLPKRTERWTVPKGHFVHKKSQENFERVTHKRLIQIKDGHPETVELWLAFLKKHQYYGVGMKANVWGFDELGVGKRMNVSLETLKDVPRPKWTHFGSRRSFETADKVREILASEGYKPLSAEPEQIDAALNQITNKEAVRAKIKEILSSPVYRSLAGEPQEVPVEEKLIVEKLMVEEEIVQTEALMGALVEDKIREVPAEAEEPVFEVKPEDETLANIPNEATQTSFEVPAEAKAAGEAVSNVVEATPDQAQAEATLEDEALTNALEESAPEAPAPIAEAQAVLADIPELPEVTPRQTNIEVNHVANASGKTPTAAREAPVEEVVADEFEAAPQQTKPEENAQVKPLNETVEVVLEAVPELKELVDTPVMEEITEKGRVETKAMGEIREEIKVETKAMDEIRGEREIKEATNEEGKDEKKE